ncbi:uncharacterized protein B0T23DRAFT_433387 [Neurospora hispaniola]|uniref:Uncharacterized protein n=1 Tax=Neurospora hispaniola TaxID=588809 RepID=A0AAJ0MLL3_9PEZI|nr:hypothetical protein B0T23DRAFT_433387 [Neurospora hispaniola]
MSKTRLRPLKIPSEAAVASLLITPHWNRFAGDPDSELKRKNINEKDNNKKKSDKISMKQRLEEATGEEVVAVGPALAVAASSPPDEPNGPEVDGAEINDIEGSEIGRSDTESIDPEESDTENDATGDSDDEGQDTLGLESGDDGVFDPEDESVLEDIDDADVFEVEATETDGHDSAEQSVVDTRTAPQDDEKIPTPYVETPGSDRKRLPDAPGTYLVVLYSKAHSSCRFCSVGRSIN